MNDGTIEKYDAEVMRIKTEALHDLLDCSKDLSLVICPTINQFGTEYTLVSTNDYAYEEDAIKALVELKDQSILAHLSYTICHVNGGGALNHVMGFNSHFKTAIALSEVLSKKLGIEVKIPINTNKQYVYVNVEKKEVIVVKMDMSRRLN